MDNQTPSTVAKALHVSVGTVRNWSKEYGEHLTPQARGDQGHRRFTDADVALLRLVADLRSSGMARGEILQRLQSGTIPVVVDVAPESPQTAQDAPHGAIQPADLSTPVLMTIQRQIDDLQDRDRERFAAAAYGFVAGFVAFAVVFWLVWLLASLAR